MISPKFAFLIMEKENKKAKRDEGLGEKVPTLYHIAFID